MNREFKTKPGVARRLIVGLLLVATFLAVAACQQIPRPDVNVPPGAAATAAAMAQQAGSAAATAAAVAAEQAPTTIATLQAVELPDAGVLREKIASALPDESGNVRVTISDDDLNRVIQARLRQEAAAGDPAQMPLQNPVVTFAAGSIVLAGDVTQPVSGRLTVTFRPYVLNGGLQFEIMSATLGTITVPPVLLQTAESTLNSTLGDALNALPAAVQLHDITVAEGTLTLVAGR
jgi:hypothetical protein